MRKSQRRAGAYLLRAGIATTAVAAAVIASSTAALAADVVVTFSPTSGTVGGGNSITVTGTGVYTSVTTPGARLTSATTCPTTLGTTSSAGNFIATATKTDANSGTVTVPAAVALAGTYRVCLYAGTTSTSAIAGHSTTPVYSVVAATLSSTPATAGAGNTATLTVTAGGAAWLTNYTTIGALFATGTCPTLYTTTSVTTATATKTNATDASVTAPNTLANGTYNLCVYGGTTVGTSALLGSGSTLKVLPGITLSPSVGPAGVATPITVTGATAILSGITSPGVQFNRTACTDTYGATPAGDVGTSITKISNSKLVVTVPTSVDLTGAETSAQYNTCVYAGTGPGALLIAAAATYTIAPNVSLTAINPAAGPAQGGSTVTITGTGFPTDPTAVSVSIGGSPVTVTGVTGTSITGTTSAHAPGQFNVSVTTAAGTKTLTGSNGFTFAYGITVTPNTAPPAPTSGTPPTVFLDILGAGFSALTWGTGNPVANGDARVFLVNDTYDPTASTGDWANPPITECTSVIPISDTEIICSFDLATTLNADGTTNTADVPIGTYTVTVVSDSTPGASLTAGVDTSIVSSGSTFTVAPF
ncbi:IPT/TIG domain-containing protein [Krasilnikovia sp. MM14-A1004]|uniref:IPT/TIG domain-containing protein n=1 Tax=Krasilnikovia sp. MM14-A1004 TaxID=3373541 RepID=UPI00399D3C14